MQTLIYNFDFKFTPYIDELLCLINWGMGGLQMNNWHPQQLKKSNMFEQPARQPQIRRQMSLGTYYMYNMKNKFWAVGWAGL